MSDKNKKFSLSATTTTMVIETSASFLANLKWLRTPSYERAQSFAQRERTRNPSKGQN